MSRAVLIAGLTLLASAAQAQTTNCIHIGTVLSCTTTPAPQQGPGLEPGYQSLANSIEELAAERAAQRQAQAEAARQARAMIDAFAADPAHPLFSILAPRMAQLLTAGRAASLQQAYDIALADSIDAPLK